MAKPTTYPRWATGGSAVVAIPASGQQDDGWAVQQKPAAQFLNWLALHAYNWLNWLGTVFTGDQVLIIPPGGMMEDAGANPWTYSGGGAGNTAKWVSPTAAGAFVDVPIELPVGARIKNVLVRIKDTTETLEMSVWKYVDGGTGTQVGSTQTSAGNTTEQDLQVSSLTEVIAASTHYKATVKANGTSNAKRVFQAEITYDWP